MLVKQAFTEHQVISNVGIKVFTEHYVISNVGIKSIHRTPCYI